MTRVLVAPLAIAFLLGACSSKTATSAASPSPSSSAAPADPKTPEELQAFAQVHFNSFGYGDYASFWDDFDSGSKAVVSRAEYVRRLTACMAHDPNKNSPWTVVRVSQNKDGTWSVVVHYVKYDITFPAVYENGHWRFVLSPDARRAMTMPFNQYLQTQCVH